MKKIVSFGNCQGDALAQLLRIGLDESEYAVEFVSNNPLTAPMKDPPSILARIAGADVVLFQPLRERHGPLAEESVRSVARGVTVTFPYMFNSGLAGLCHAPTGNDHPYGNMFGEEAVIEMLDHGAVEDDVVAAYEQGAIDFRLPERFETCMERLRPREARTDVRVADWIVTNHRETQLFLTHNHPTIALLAEVCAQISEAAGVPVDVGAIRRSQEEPLKHRQLCPISPHDARAMGYRFPASADWAALGRGLIHLICAEHSRAPDSVS